MSASAGISTPGEKEEKPGWGLPSTVFAVLSLVLRLTEVRSWWAALWAPLFVLAIGVTAYAWRITARLRWRMGPMEWVFLVVTHLGLLLSLARVLGRSPR
ncbi:hypothetical protein ACFCXA_27895 [Streptomyces virginiae]|uniref:hypothetical protein n=1 Tax=Streptomyces virginiae TaxID=1961 RepID=UPI00324DB0E5